MATRYQIRQAIDAVNEAFDSHECWAGRMDGDECVAVREKAKKDRERVIKLLKSVPIERRGIPSFVVEAVGLPVKDGKFVGTNAAAELWLARQGEQGKQS